MKKNLFLQSRPVFNNPEGGSRPQETTSETVKRAPEKTSEQRVSEAAIIYKSNYRNLVAKIDQYASSKNQRIAEIAKKYRDRLNASLADPTTVDALGRKAQQENIKRVSAVIIEFSREVRKASIEGPRVQKKEEKKEEEKGKEAQKEAEPEWLTSAKSTLKKTCVDALGKLQKMRYNKYTNEYAEKGRYFIQIRNKIQEIAGKADSAKTIQEFSAMEKQVKSLTSEKNIDTALKKDWGAALMQYAVQRAFDNIKPDEDPTAITGRIQANMRQFLSKEPFTSLPGSMSVRVAEQGITFNVRRQGKRVLASITDMLPHMARNYPRIASYLSEKKEKAA